MDQQVVKLPKYFTVTSKTIHAAPGRPARREYFVPGLEKALTWEELLVLLEEQRIEMAEAAQDRRGPGETY